MAQVRIEVDAGITVEVVEGTDSSAELLALKEENANLKGKISAAKTQLAAIAAADATEDAARMAAIAALD